MANENDSTGTPTLADHKSLSPRDLCARTIDDLKPGQVLAVGGKAWTVNRSHGLTKYLVRAGAKGRKYYRLEATKIEPCCVAVREVDGNGASKDTKPAAVGCFVSESVFAGSVRPPRVAKPKAP